MNTDSSALRAAVSADLPWREATAIRGTLRLDDEALVLDPTERSAGRLSIPIASIERAGIETTLGVRPALNVWHTVRGQEVRSRFEFLAEDAGEEEEQASDFGLADRVGPGLARDAATRLEGGLRALSGGLKGGKRAVRQVVAGVARQEEYRQWPAAIAQAQEALQRRAAPRTAEPSAPHAPPPAPPPPLVPDMTDPPTGDTRARFAWFTRDVLGWIDACGARGRELGVKGAPVLQATYPLDSPVCRIVVAGEFSRGKSTLINALFGIHGEIALPTGMTPTTPLACAIRVPSVGETDGATITYRTARPALQLTLDAFRAGVWLAEEGEARATGAADVPLHLDEARRIEVRITGAYLPAGVEIEDTPGLHEQSNRSRAALAALGRADLVLFVLAADQLLGNLEQEVIDRTLLQGHHRNVLFLVNFWDSIDDEAQRAILRRRADTILGAIPSPFTSPAPSGQAHGQSAPVFYVSALQAARAQRQRKAAPEESGIPQLRAFLRELLGPGSSALLLRARAGRALRYVELLQQAVSKAGAASTLDGARPRDARTQSYREAMAAATRLLDSLPGVVDSAVVPALASHSTQAPSMQRVAALIARAGAGDAAALQEARRSLAAEQRAAAGACAEIAQRVLDPLFAQVRAAFLTRSLAAPALHGHLEVPAPALPEQVSVADLWARFDSSASTLREACRAGAERLRQSAAGEMRAFVDAASEAPQPARADTDGAMERQRLAALRALEEDLVRLRRAVTRCLEA